MIVRTPKQLIEEYFNNETHINQGLLKKLIGGVASYNRQKEKKLYYEEEEFLIIGSAVDVKLTQEESTFNEEFYLSSLVSKPSDAIMSITQEVFDALIETRRAEEIQLLHNNLALFPDLIVKACENHHWNDRWGAESKVKNLVLAASEYFNELVKSSGKMIITLEEKMVVDSIVNSIKNNPVTGYYFQDHENIVIFYQKPLYVMINGANCKMMPDIILLEKESGFVDIIDVKTAYDSVIGFPDQAMKFRYDIQAAFYMNGLRRHLNENNGKLDGHSVQEIRNFKFIVESTGTTGNPILYTASNSFLNMGKYGREEITFMTDQHDERMGKLNFSPVYGYLFLLDLYKWHLENGFEVDRIIKENENQLTLNWNRKQL